ncbi:MAG: 4Fe-4S binding protein [Spirochaetes bacterium]|nr:4Fe-4S binding protein [Spirochaetota bacterium]
MERGVSVYTVGDLCKKCYSCVRSCPTKAIQVREGEAHIVPEYCISCGLCVNMCTQDAKKIVSHKDEVGAAIAGSGRVYALLAPSFPGAFLDLDPGCLVAALHRLGFDKVFEVAFGADLVSYRYKKTYEHILKQERGTFIITSPCPSVVFYIEKYFPELLDSLAPIVSPMEATARAIRGKIDREATLVFIGPCIAKKDEAKESETVDYVLTYQELSDLLEGARIDPATCEPVEFDPPHANLGRIYPVTGGLLKAADIDSDLLESPVTVIEGPERVRDILSVLSKLHKEGGTPSYRIYDLLFCEGCIGGPVMMNNLTFFERKKFIVRYMTNRPLITDLKKWAQANVDYLDIDLSVRYTPKKGALVDPPAEKIQEILAMTNKFKPEDELNCGACGYSSCRDKAIAVYRGMAEVEMCLPYLISKIEQTVEDLKTNQARLIQAEKLASMGQMAAGIAHEINNPLGVVLMYSYILKDELLGNTGANEDLDRIITEAERTRKIVKGILNFAREEKIDRSLVDINRLVQSSVEGALKGHPDGLYGVEYRLDEKLGLQSVDKNQIQQVFDNLIKNACEAMPGGGTLGVSTKEKDGSFSVCITDTGCGIPKENLSKLFSPFFTTKQVGKGTGLGLSVCYGIVKMHGGSIEADNNPEGGARFTVTIKKTHTVEDGGSVVIDSPEGDNNNE